MSYTPFGYSEKLPENIKDAFMWLCQDVSILQSKWDFFSYLFGTKANTDLLSELAPASFNMIFDSLLNDITMAICRLSDPSKSGRDLERYNLSFSTLVDMCDQIEGLKELLKDFRNVCKPITQTRNRRVGHRDLDTAIRPLENPLPGITKQQIERILKTATDFLNTVYKNYDNGFLVFHMVVPGGADALIFWLTKAKASDSEMKQ